MNKAEITQRFYDAMDRIVEDEDRRAIYDFLQMKRNIDRDEAYDQGYHDGYGAASDQYYGEVEVDDDKDEWN